MTLPVGSQILGYKYKEDIWSRQLCILAYIRRQAVASARMILLGQPCCGSSMSTWFCWKPQLWKGLSLIYLAQRAFTVRNCNRKGTALIFLFRADDDGTIRTTQDDPNRTFSIYPVIPTISSSLPMPPRHLCLCGFFKRALWKSTEKTQ